METVLDLKGNFKPFTFKIFLRKRQIPQMCLEFIVQYANRCALILYILKVIVKIRELWSLILKSGIHLSCGEKTYQHERSLSLLLDNTA